VLRSNVLANTFSSAMAIKEKEKVIQHLEPKVNEIKLYYVLLC
jgi:hypothetical protein